MRIEPRHLNSRFELAALYRRRETVLSLIRSLERYRQAVGGRIPERSRRTSSAAA